MMRGCFTGGDIWFGGSIEYLSFFSGIGLIRQVPLDFSSAA
jgi:hypothetical protein